MKPSCFTPSLKSPQQSFLLQSLLVFLSCCSSAAMCYKLHKHRRKARPQPLFSQGSHPPLFRLHGAQQTSPVIASSMAKELYQLGWVKWVREVALTHKTKNNVRCTRVERGKWDNGTFTGTLSRSEWHSTRAMRTGRHKKRQERRQRRVGGEERHDLGTKYAEWLYSK